MRGVVLLALVACGRIGYEPRLELDTDAPGDTAAATCPPDTKPFTTMTASVTTTMLCIETAERGTKSWTDAKGQCEAIGRRLCTDLEWVTACEDVTGLVDMAGDGNWEWVAEQEAGVAKKRGLDVCGDTSAHEIFVDPYDFRCCVNL